MCIRDRQLTYHGNSFDVCTSTELFEHVPDDVQGFRELRRVLKPGGILLFTVPMMVAEETLERARLVDGRIQHLLTPEYHNDRIRGSSAVLCFRNYGQDILYRLSLAGFNEPRIIQGDDITGWGFHRQVLAAHK